MMVIPKIDVGEMIRDSAEEDEVRPTRLAADVGKTEVSIRQWMNGNTQPGARDLIQMMALLPSLERRVLAKVKELRAA